jgi:hypothetical protein
MLMDTMIQVHYQRVWTELFVFFSLIFCSYGIVTMIHAEWWGECAFCYFDKFVVGGWNQPELLELMLAVY